MANADEQLIRHTQQAAARGAFAQVFQIDSRVRFAKDEEKAMSKRFWLFALVPALLFVGAADAQYPVLDMVAQT